MQVKGFIMTNQTVIQRLNEELNPKSIKQREGSFGSKLDYLPGHKAEDNANRVFDYKIHKKTIEMDKLFERSYQKEIWEKEKPTGKFKDMFEVAYKAKVQATALIDGEWIVREGTGAGNGQSGNLFDCYELAIKEAETDAMRRALKSFGKQFGLELYDKDADLNATDFERAAKADDYLQDVIEQLRVCTTKAQVTKIKAQYNGAYQARLDELCERKMIAIDNDKKKTSYEPAAEQDGDNKLDMTKTASELIK